jgi:AraC-like DNA-binding protein
MSVAYGPTPPAAPRDATSAIEVVIPCETSDAVVLGIERDFFRRKAREALGAGAPEPLQRYAALDPFMRGVANALRDDFRRQSLPSAAFLESLAGVIAMHLARNSRDGVRLLNVAAGPAVGRVQRAQEFIERHFDEPLRVDQVAAVAHMSPFHFARTFKQATGLAPHAYLTSCRVARAKAMLAETMLALVEVAARAGFKTQGHFTEVFRRHVGTTPRLFRLQANGRNPAYPRKDREQARFISA